jgi:catechol 2,3-dioxygenase-like lactoylglutathione lyase family enzyme
VIKSFETTTRKVKNRIVIISLDIFGKPHHFSLRASNCLQEVKMKTIQSLVLCCVLLCGVAVLSAQAPHWLWARGVGGTGYDEGISITIDNQGNQYVTGRFESTVSFGSHILTSNGWYDMFVAKLDPDGNWLWVVQAGGTAGAEWGGGVALDGAGNVYLTGGYGGTVSFGSYTLTSSGYGDMFVAKLDPNGNWLWAVSAGGGNTDEGNSIAVDGWGNAYVAVHSDSETITIGSCTLTRFGPGMDIYVAKLDPYGNWLWAVQAGGPDQYDEGYDIAVDGEGNPWVTGKFQGTATFGSQTLTSGGGTDIFVAKLNTNGNWLWAVQAGGTAGDIGYGIAVDGAGNAWVTGIFGLAASFGSHTLTTNSFGDIFVAKLDASGNWLWAVQAGGTSGDAGYGIALDGSGNAYVTGTYSYNATFGSHSLTAVGGNDIFVAKLDPSGNWLWAASAGGTKPDEGYYIAVDGSGIAYVTGYYRETGATFGSHALPPNGFHNIFVAKLGMHPGAGIPVAPGNLSITRNGTHIFLDWGDVEFDLAGNPVSVDHYRVYYCASGPAGPFTVFGEDGSITQSQWTHSGVASLSPGFYYVTAVVAN